MAPRSDSILYTALIVLKFDQLLEESSYNFTGKKISQPFDQSIVKAYRLATERRPQIKKGTGWKGKKDLSKADSQLFSCTGQIYETLGKGEGLGVCITSRCKKDLPDLSDFLTFDALS